MTDTLWGCGQECPRKVQINLEQFFQNQNASGKNHFLHNLNIQNPNKVIIMEGIKQQFLNLLDNCRV